MLHTSVNREPKIRQALSPGLVISSYVFLNVQLITQIYKTINNILIITVSFVHVCINLNAIISTVTQIDIFPTLFCIENNSFALSSLFSQVEGGFSIFGETPADQMNDMRIWGLVTLILLFGISMAGMAWESKAQLVLLVLLIGAMINFFVGTFIRTDEKTAQGFYSYNCTFVLRVSIRIIFPCNTSQSHFLPIIYFIQFSFVFGN